MAGDVEEKNTLLILSNSLKTLADKFSEQYELSDGLLISPTSGDGLEYPPIQIASIYKMLNDYSDKLVYLSKFEKELKLDINIFPAIVNDYKIAGTIIDEIIEKDDNNDDGTYRAINGFLIWLSNIGLQIDNLFSLDFINNKEFIPSVLKKRIIFYEKLIGGLENKVDGIEAKVEAINNAHKAAVDLPVLLNDLEEGDKKLHELRNKSEENNDYINNLKGRIEAYHSNCEEKNKIIDAKFQLLTEDISFYLKKYKEEAEGYISKCEDAYRTTTSSGLAKAFEDKANKLNKSINNWVKILIASLILAAGVGFYRLTSLEMTLSDKDASFFIVLVQILLSALSLGIPLWLAWLATKQIGQRFRLAEDYEYKSAVSKAYEGYRREAVNLNEKYEDNFPSRLFDNALTRLEEPPVRFVDDTIYSSPVMEFLNSDKVRSFFKKNPEKSDAAIAAINSAKGEGIKEKEDSKGKNKDNVNKNGDDGNEEE